MFLNGLGLIPFDARFIPLVTRAHALQRLFGPIELTQMWSYL